MKKSLIRTKLLSKNQDFLFTQIKQELWWEFKKQDTICEASLEKAIVDMLYLKKQGRRSFAIDEWYIKPIDKKLLKKYLQKVDIVGAENFLPEL